MRRIHDSLRHVLGAHRIVLWYDGAGEWNEAFSSFSDENVVKLRVEGNEFGTKVRVVRDPKPDAKFLIFVPTVRPADAENWLLDLLLQGHEFKADKASLALQEVGLPQDYLYLAEKHAMFFRSEKRIAALKECLHKDDLAPQIRLKMMGVLAGSEPDIDALLLSFLRAAEDGELFDRVAECFGGADLAEPFWAEVERAFGYSSPVPTLRDFAVSLFRGANPLDRQVALHPHARVFLQRWKDSQAHSASYRLWADQMETELQIAGALARVEEVKSLGDWDTFAAFEKFTLHRLCRLFENGAAAVDVRDGIQQRRTSFWFPTHRDGYAALENAVDLRELLAGAELGVDSVDTGLRRYTASWWRIDQAYRRCMWHLRCYQQVQLMERISQWAEKAYVNNFLLPLADRWGDQVRRLGVWECEELPPQRQFFQRFVQPFLTKGQKVFVIVSDALRYEAAAEFADRLRSANRWTAELEAVLGTIPSYTQLGMAALLPGRSISVDPMTSNVLVDGRSATGTANRAEILRQGCGGKATALAAEDFLEMNTKTDGRALMRDHEVIYIFHNRIDKVGDDAVTEAKTFEAVDQAFKELDQIIRKVANINGSNMLLTADHGFLFQQDDVHAGDMATLPFAEAWHYKGRRHALGRDIRPTTTVKVFRAVDLGLQGDWSAAFPLSLGRFPLQGSGKRFVHGGISLQEVVVPVVKIHKARADDTGKVEVELLNVPAKITTGRVALSLFQDRPAVGKVLPRTLRLGLFAKDDSPLSEIKTLCFDSKDPEARNRERTEVLMLSHAADAFHNREVEVRLEEMLPGTNQKVTYKTHSLKLWKPFASDFDEL